MTFDQIRFIGNDSGSGFESDNHTIVSDYTSTSGKSIYSMPEPSISSVPEPSEVLGILALGFIGLASRFKRSGQNQTNAHKSVNSLAFLKINVRTVSSLEIISAVTSIPEVIG